MASTLQNELSVVCCSGGIEELADVDSSVSATTTDARGSQEYCYAVASSASGPAVRFRANSTHGNAGSFSSVFGVFFTDLSPASAYSIYLACERATAADNGSFRLALDTNGDLLVYAAWTGTSGPAGTLLATISSPFTVNTWHDIRVDCWFDNVGDIRVWIMVRS